MLKVGMIGVGGAGNNIVSHAKSKYPITALNINTNMGDISDITIASYIIEGSNGVAQDREKASELLDEKVLKDIKNKSKVLFKGHDLIYIVGCAGGGTGSGIIPHLAENLNEGDTETIFVPVMGSAGKEDSLQELKNTGSCIKDLWTKRKASFMIFKNNEKDKAKLDKELVDRLFYPFLPRVNDIGNIDHEELKSLFSTKGMLSIKAFDKLGKLKENIFIDDKAVEKVGVWADNCELPDLKGYDGAKIFKGKFLGELPSGVLKVESGHLINMNHLENLSREIKNKEDKSKKIADIKNEEFEMKTLDDIKKLGF